MPRSPRGFLGLRASAKVCSARKGGGGARRRRRGTLDLIGCRRFTLVHLIERRAREQNSTAWIKIEPVDHLPHPLTMMKM